jgi:hypothetical protein
MKNGYEIAGQRMKYARQRNEMNLPGYLISYIHLGE